MTSNVMQKKSTFLVVFTTKVMYIIVDDCSFSAKKKKRKLLQFKFLPFLVIQPRKMSTHTTKTIILCAENLSLLFLIPKQFVKVFPQILKRKKALLEKRFYAP